jgi:hypothetical protein
MFLTFDALVAVAVSRCRESGARIAGLAKYSTDLVQRRAGVG